MKADRCSAALVMGPPPWPGPDDRAAAQRRSNEELRRFREFRPHAPRGRPDGKAAWWAGVGGRGPGQCGRLGDEALRGGNKQGCVCRRQQLQPLRRGVRQLVPARARPTRRNIGRLRPRVLAMRGRSAQPA